MTTLTCVFYTKIYGHFLSHKIVAITTRWWYYQGGHTAGFPCIYRKYNFYTLECYELQCFIYVLHFQSKIWVKPAGEQSFLHGNHILKSGFGRITENTPQYQGVIVYSMNDLPLVSEKKLSPWREILFTCIKMGWNFSKHVKV